MTDSPEYKHLLPDDFHPSSRVWVYQCSRLLMIREALEVEEMLNVFIAQWQSHGRKVKGFGTLFLGQFLILMADETMTEVSGCSTDSSVHLIKKMESTFGVQLLDRQLLAFWHKGKVQTLPLSQVGYALGNGLMNGDTLYFNNLVTDKEKLEKEWLIPVKESWLRKYLPAGATLSS